MRRTFVAVVVSVLIVCSLILTGCPPSKYEGEQPKSAPSSNWWKHNANLYNDGYIPVPDPAPPLELAWRITVGDTAAAHANSYPVFGRGTVFTWARKVDEPDLGRMMAVSLADGAVLWTYTPQPLEDTNAARAFDAPVAANDRLYVSFTFTHEEDGMMVTPTTSSFVALDAETGAEVWSVQLDPYDLILTPPTMAFGKLYTVGLMPVTLVALDVSDGSEVWATPLLESEEDRTPVSAFGSLIVAGRYGIYWYNSENGDLKRKLDLEPPLAYEPAAPVALTDVPIGSPGLVFVAGVVHNAYGGTGFDSRVYAINGSRARIEWEERVPSDTPSSSLHLVAGDGLVFLVHYRTVTAFDALTGETEWIHNMSTPGRYWSAAVVQGYLYLRAKNRIEAVDAETGTLVWSDDLPGSCYHMRWALAIDQGYVVVPHGAYLSAYRPVQ
jgi:outer membrane protein assembly factor BamB